MEKEEAILLREKIKAAQLMLKQIDDSLAKFLNIEIPKEDLYQAEEYFLVDDCKSYG